MATYTRGEFLGMSAALVGAAGLGLRPGSEAEAAQADAGSGATADLALVNGRVYTMDEAQPRAEAFAVRNGTIVAVGSTADIRNLVTSRTDVIDAGGMTVTPGFIDAHCHPATGGLRELVNVNLDLRSIQEIVVAIRDKASTAASPDHWIDGFKYDDTKVVDGRRINRFDLDEATPDNPVRVTHRGGHLSWYNSKALQMAGVTRDTPDPQGGRFEHDAEGELTGLVEERANRVFNGIGVRDETTRDERRQGVELITELMTAAGLTSVHDATTSSNSATAYQDALHNWQLRCRITMLVSGGLFEAAKAGGLYTGFGNEWVRIGPVKFAADGSASGRTMYMSTPYVGTDDYGILTMTPEEIHEAVEDAHRHDFQIGIHANGDRTIGYVLDAYERVLRMWPHPDRRHRLEHCSLVNPELLRRIKASGSIPTPFWTYAHYHGNKWVEYGPDGVDVRAQVVPRLRYPGRRRLRLRAGPVRAADGDSEHGDAEGLRGAGLGTQPEGDGGPGAAHRHRERRLRLIRRGRKRLDRRRQVRRLRRAAARSARRRPGCDQGDRGRPDRRRRPDDASEGSMKPRGAGAAGHPGIT